MAKQPLRELYQRLNHLLYDASLTIDHFEASPELDRLPNVADMGARRVGYPETEKYCRFKVDQMIAHAEAIHDEMDRVAKVLERLAAEVQPSVAETGPWRELLRFNKK